MLFRSGDIKVTVSKLGYITSVIDNSFSTLLVKQIPNSVSDECTYYYNGNYLQLAKIKVNELEEQILDYESGQIIYKKQKIQYLKDTTALGTIFNPDPLTTAVTSYGSPYIDNDDSDNTALTNEIDTVVLSLTYDEIKDTFLLENKIVKITLTCHNTRAYAYVRTRTAFYCTNTFLLQYRVITTTVVSANDTINNTLSEI